MKTKFDVLLVLLLISFVSGGCSKKEDSPTSGGGTVPPPTPSGAYDGTYTFGSEYIAIANNEVVAISQDTFFCRSTMSGFSPPLTVAPDGTFSSPAIGGSTPTYRGYIYDLANQPKINLTLFNTGCSLGEFGYVLAWKQSNSILSYIYWDDTSGSGNPFQDGKKGSGTIAVSPVGSLHPFGTSVTLIPQPGVNSQFKKWTGDCNGTSPCSFTTSKYVYDVEGEFIPKQYLLNISFVNDTSPQTRTGNTVYSLSATLNGTISDMMFPSSSAHGATHTESYNYDTSVSIELNTSVYLNFVGWSGDCSGVGNCIVTMNSEKNVTAHFTEK